MKPAWRLVLSALLVALPLVGCGGGGASPILVPAVDPERFVVGVTHAYLPLEPGRVWVYEGDEDGQPLREVVRTTDATRVIRGTPCTGLEVQVFLDEVLVEVTTEWFAQDKDGNVWKFGEETSAFDGVSLVPTPDSWLVDEGGVGAFVVLAARPRPGERYVGRHPDGSDTLWVRAVDAVAAVPAGEFQGCLELVENLDDPADQDIILYAPRVGRVSERSANGSVHLVSTQG
jgi:hypothetical protein